MLSREEIVTGLKKIVSPSQVITEEQLLKEYSVDRYYKVESIWGIYSLPTPAAIVRPANTQEVSKILMFCNEHLINVVPRTGGSATEGGLETAVENSIVLDGSDMKKIINIDTYNMQATVECGVVLETLENEVRALGFTTGHSPQSKPLAQLGGLTATRSTGQFSTLYGGIEELIVGLEAVFPNGQISRIKNVPRRAAGPDIRHVIVGNEGTMSFITEVTVKLFKYYPENHQFYGYILDDMELGFKLIHDVITAGYRPSVVRLYSPEDAHYHFSHFHEGKSVLLFMAEGPKGIVEATSKAIEEIVGKANIQQVDSKHIANWFYSLNWDEKKVEEERIEVKETNNCGFTTEVSAGWSAIYPIYKNSIDRIRKEIPDLTLLGAHSSHSYINGTNLYFVYYYDMNCKPEEEMSKYHDPIQNIIVEETLKAGGSMCHHHGVGKHRTHFLAEEYGNSLYILKELKKAFDPKGIMNKGTIFGINEKF
ncbi:FAD-binding oxidoreductase (plasmid) [Entomospira entomophila]|uniref:FAD-binding oxidoreductase n=1 Tax=Entomospira entomophila TaxID=2719988 RepID=A0A968G9Z7_9SPIO|nr:FAD-binding oxidoreductase [Entomospira entomophilus]NIZ41315.1 FAD-binding oxidoreductase [Entomospira entomophilus]WDI36162.1 FAD-binding oxidoreductase [Entomospira entomophilus]